MRFSNRSKYHAVKVKTSEGTFDSKREYMRWLELKEQQEKGLIKELQRQTKILLIPEQREPDIVSTKGKVKKGKIIERACNYIADFTYIKDGEIVIEDAKGLKTKEYIIKRKLVLERYGIRIKEV